MRRFNAARSGTVQTVLFLSLLAPAVAADAKASPSLLSWGVSATVDGGYDDNVSISPYAKLGTKQPSGVASAAAELKGGLHAGRFTSTLTYGFDQSFYFSYGELDMQTHGLDLEGQLAAGPLQLDAGYGVDFLARLPTAGVFYSIEHEATAGVDAALHGYQVHAVAGYGLTYFDLRDSTYAYLGGVQHVARIFPRLFLFDALLLSVGYRFERVELGTVEDVISRGGGETAVELPLSFSGHFGFITGYWEPHPSVGLLLLLKAGRRYYDGFSTGGGGTGGPGRDSGGQRIDNLFRINPLLTWQVARGFTLEGSFTFEASGSSISSRQLSGSYTNLIATVGVSYAYSSASD